LGKREILTQAFANIGKLPPSRRERNDILEVCIKHFKYLQEKTAIGLTTQEEDFMKTMQEIDAIYQAEMQRARWEGAIDGKQEIVLRQLQRRIGNISTDLEMQVMKKSLFNS
jgi:Domain of unknown function (DUF4351)